MLGVVARFGQIGDDDVADRAFAMPPAEIRAGLYMLGDQDLLRISPEALRDVRGAKVGFVFQDPMTSLNPVFNVGFQIAEPLRRHMGLTKAQAADRAVELLELVGIP